MAKTLLIAHRGYREIGRGENLLADFERAIRQHVDGLEIDVHYVNQRFILAHDTPASQTSMMHYETLEDVIRLVRKQQFSGSVIIELKSHTGARELASYCEQIQLVNPIVLQSFQIAHVRQWCAFRSSFKIGYLRHWVDSNVWIYRHQIDYLNLDWRFWWLNWLRPRKSLTYWWTVNQAGIIKYLLRRHAIGIITDNIVLAKQIEEI